ncbi:Tim10/DDP family zinc finger [Opisthorchis viverrini]|uniref:Mitochondrial import inner membrane translocase subunit n=1 Tax=Opisthorchis viverrini TaxID=6198 RepID=A0A1S8WRL1_OPIVI|nr:Tim10/DDP family zinc finger [Opisthorchis viverrini]
MSSDLFLIQMQIKETSELYVRCSTVCFDRCVSNFTARKLNDSEVRESLSCIEKCTEKFAKMNQRLTLRLFELNKEELAKQ